MRSRLSRRSARFERLEARLALAADSLGAVTGQLFEAFDDASGTVETPLIGTTVELYADDGDSIFSVSDDELRATTLTDSAGVYRFDGLAAGAYWVRSSVPGLFDPFGPVSLVVITDAASAGVSVSTIDSFNSVFRLNDDLVDGLGVASQQADPGVLGGERDVEFVEQASGGFSSGGGAVIESGGDFAGQIFYSTFDTDGLLRLSYDGVDLAAQINGDGLGGEDLTAGGAEAFALTAGFSGTASVTVRVYSSEDDFSEAQFDIDEPSDGGAYHVRFDELMAAGGLGADLTNVGAIELIIDPTSGSSFVVDEFGLARSTSPETADLRVDVEAPPVDLGIAGGTPNLTVNPGETVVVDFVVSNFSSRTATGVVVDVEAGGVIEQIEFGDIAPAGSVAAQAEVTVPDTATGSVLVSLTTSANEQDGSSGNNTLGLSLSVSAHTTSLSGVVFEDLNGDGIQDSNEPGIAGVAITLFEQVSGLLLPVGSAVTDDAGFYTINGIVPGTYQLVQSQPSGFDSTGVTVGTGGGLTDGLTTVSDIQVLAAGDPLTGYHFAEQETETVVPPVIVEPPIEPPIDPEPAPEVEPPGSGGLFGVFLDEDELLRTTRQTPAAAPVLLGTRLSPVVAEESQATVTTTAANLRPIREEVDEIDLAVFLEPIYDFGPELLPLDLGDAPPEEAELESEPEPADVRTAEQAPEEGQSAVLDRGATPSIAAVVDEAFSDFDGTVGATVEEAAPDEPIATGGGFTRLASATGLTIAVVGSTRFRRRRR